MHEGTQGSCMTQGVCDIRAHSLIPGTHAFIPPSIHSFSRPCIHSFQFSADSYGASCYHIKSLQKPSRETLSPGPHSSPSSQPSVPKLCPSSTLVAVSHLTALDAHTWRGSPKEVAIHQSYLGGFRKYPCRPFPASGPGFPGGLLQGAPF